MRLLICDLTGKILSEHNTIYGAELAKGIGRLAVASANRTIYDKTMPLHEMYRGNADFIALANNYAIMGLTKTPI